MDEDMVIDREDPSGEIFAALLYLNYVFAPSRAPFAFVGVVPYEPGKKMTENVDLSTVIRSTKRLLPVMNPAELYRQFRYYYPQGRYWVVIQATRLEEQLQSPEDLAFLDSEFLEKPQPWNTSLFQTMQDLEAKMGMTGDRAKVILGSPEWISRSNIGPLPPRQFETVAAEIRKLNERQTEGVELLLSVFNPGRVPFLLMGMMENCGIEEMERQLRSPSIFRCPWAKPVSSPQDLLNQFREHYPTDHYWLIIIDHAQGTDAAGPTRRGDAHIFNTVSLEVAVQILGNRSLYEFRQVAANVGLTEGRNKKRFHLH